ncbi:MAG: hypothetical protein NC336_05320 [Clostridium sp.]|nr:hypothetical protein [Clostridium sp.]
MRHLPIAILLTAAALLCCGRSGNDSSGTARYRVAPEDSVAFKLGEEHGRALIENSNDTSAIADGLLEIRARETDIRSRIRPSAADAYVAGFEQYIREHAPDLAAKLF